MKERTIISLIIICISFIMVGITIMSNNLYSINKVSGSLSGLFIISFVLFSAFFIIYLLIIKFGLNVKVIFVGFLIIYYTVGIVPISSYREGINSEMWILLLFTAVISFIIGNYLSLMLLKINKGYTGKSTSSYINNKNTIILFTLSLISSLIIYLQHGVLILNQSSRFNVSGILQYLTEMIIPITVSIFAFYITTNKKKNFLLITLVTSFVIILSLGYRNQPMLLVISVLLIIIIHYIENNKNEISLFKVLFLSLITTLSVSIFSLFLIYRHETSVSLLKWQDFIEGFHVDLYQFVNPILPFHLAAREGMGVTEVAVERREVIDNMVGSNGLFLQDLLTVLPDISLTAGRVLGIVVNLNENVSLTPSILGGLFIQYGVVGIIIFFIIIGCLYNVFWTKYKNNQDPKYLALSVLLTIYSFELVNRGLFKPMYILIFIIPLFIFKRRKKDG
ncbi:O-antigen polysaccharide polymerase Wzy [Sporosarcina sp. E16_8]|uniref:O-antigen polysaccharide polymerase Wzy n=1 Tax=Sporosarcina sp. E16_8 TaxID=2789295 RepID=UPI001A92B916|nr:O-antigen polysaccharide polymerase Wzy [Sporosarcina sp. E16_8]MBO0589172.1 O-antigen polysaccharide polymerase Wzy [Sporosarcina sp. E16_8]